MVTFVSEIFPSKSAPPVTAATSTAVIDPLVILEKSTDVAPVIDKANEDSSPFAFVEVRLSIKIVESSSPKSVKASP